MSKKKKHSHLLLTVFIVLLFIYCMFCFVFGFFLHIGVNLTDSVKNILWLFRSVAIVESVKKITPHRKKKRNSTKNRIEITRKFLNTPGFCKIRIPERKMNISAKLYYREPFCPLFLAHIRM